MLFLRLMLIAILFSIAGGAYGQTLWKGTQVGMSIDEVRRAVPEAVDSDYHNTLPDGAIEQLIVDVVDVMGKPFHASFYFNGDRLSQVTLRLREPGEGMEARVFYDTVREALHAKYAPMLSTNSTNGMFQNNESTWMNGATSITLEYSKMTGSGLPALLTISYSARVAKAGDNL